MMTADLTRLMMFTVGLVGAVSWGQEAAPAAAEAAVSASALEKLKLPGVVINLDERCLDLAGKICLDRGTLELIACSEDSKEHESIVAIAARPMHVHTALLLLGAKSGNPAMRQLVEGGDGRWVDIPPRGGEVRVSLVFPGEGGKPVERPISDFIRPAGEVGGGAAVGKAGEQQKFPTHTFLFAGSQLHGEGSGARQYLADVSGNVISIATFGDELLCLPGVHSHDNGTLLWEVDPAGLPAVGSPVTLRLRPQLRPAVERGAPGGAVPGDENAKPGK